MDTILLQPFLSWTSSFVVPMALMSRLTQSIHLFSVLLLLFPGGTFSSVFLPTYSWSRVFTCSNLVGLVFLLHLCDVLYYRSPPDVTAERRCYRGEMLPRREDVTAERCYRGEKMLPRRDVTAERRCYRGENGSQRQK